ncbi:hypothetical protein [Idiomarina loihiensis]|uniref:hypothetical protein n=1 Tax=Idiomarina loihiensis TaxID=135577 RepID=UPI0031588D11
MKSYVAVRTMYHKQKNALQVLDHSRGKRNGFTKSANVHPQFTHENISHYYLNTNNSADTYNKLKDLYKEATGRKIRTDFNAIFEHVLIFSEHGYSNLESKIPSSKLKKAMMNRCKVYAELIKKEFGFEPISIDWHFDEGTLGSGLENDVKQKSLKRNIHCHINFFNYDFKNKRSPLRHLLVKGKNHHGRTHNLNPNFCKMQDLAAEAFKNTVFKRGTSKLITNREHLDKESYVKAQLHRLQKDIKFLKVQFTELKTAILEKSLYSIANIRRQVLAMKQGLKPKR